MSHIIILAALSAIFLLTTAQGVSRDNTVQQKQGSKIQTPGLWTALGCIVTDEDYTKCVRDRSAVPKVRRDEYTNDEDTDSSEDDGPGFFDVINDFVSEGFMRFFEGDEKDKKKDTYDNNVSNNESEESAAADHEDDDDHDDDDDDDDDDVDDKEDDDDPDDDDDDDDPDDDDDDDDDEDFSQESNIVDTSNRTTKAKTKHPINKRSVEEGKNEDENKEEGRRRRKKDDKLMKLMMLGMVLKSKLSTILMLFGTLMQLKFFALSILNLLVGLVRLYLDLTKKKEPQKVIYYEQAHHQHVYDQPHENKGWFDGWFSKSDSVANPDEIAYSAYKPST